MGVPPDRVHDWDFNENFESDRRWMKRYATDLSRARKLIIDEGSRRGLDLAPGIGSDPLVGLGGKSPLNWHRDTIIGSYAFLLSTPARAPQQTPAPAGALGQQLEEMFDTAIGRILCEPLDLDVFGPRAIALIVKLLPRCPGSLREAVGSALIDALTGLVARSTSPRPNAENTRLMVLALARDVPTPDEQSLSLAESLVSLYCCLLYLAERMRGFLPGVGRHSSHFRCAPIDHMTRSPPWQTIDPGPSILRTSFFRKAY